MSDLAILIEGTNRHPRAVRIAAGERELLIDKADGTSASVAWWRLFRIEDHGTTHRFRRVDAPRWELNVTSGSDRAMLAHIGHRRLTRAIGLLHRFHGLKVIAGSIVIAVTVATHLPADWSSRFLPESAERRLVDAVLGQHATRLCHRGGGEAALRKLLVRLDPRTAATVELVAIDRPSFTVASLPGRKIVLLRYAMTELDTDTLAALLAHELSHIRHDDPATAAVRHNGFLGTWAAILQGEDRKELILQYSAEEESRADLEAMEMMRSADISIGPAADHFEQMRIARAAGSNYAAEQRDFHFGLPNRAVRWNAAARAQSEVARSVLTQDEMDAIFNFCWPGQILPSQVPGRPVTSREAQTQLPAGSGAISPAPDQR